jgi:hypothetical protein
MLQDRTALIPIVRNRTLTLISIRYTFFSGAEKWKPYIIGVRISIWEIEMNTVRD